LRCWPRLRPEEEEEEEQEQEEEQEEEQGCGKDEDGWRRSKITGWTRRRRMHFWKSERGVFRKERWWRGGGGGCSFGVVRGYMASEKQSHREDWCPDSSCP
jgi:hypothetical protein